MLRRASSPIRLAPRATIGSWALLLAILGALWLVIAPASVMQSASGSGSLPAVAALRAAQASPLPVASKELPSGRDKVDPSDDRAAERHAVGGAEPALFHDALELPAWSSRLLTSDPALPRPARRPSRKAGEIPSPRGPPSPLAC